MRMVVHALRCGEEAKRRNVPRQDDAIVAVHLVWAQLVKLRHESVLHPVHDDLAQKHVQAAPDHLPQMPTVAIVAGCRRRHRQASVRDVLR